MEHEVVLVPFGTSPQALGIQLKALLRRRGDQIEVIYDLRGDLESVVCPSRVAGGPRRSDGLWNHTCFELFLAAEGMEPYWEVNLAPNGDWNLYRLEGYRKGLIAVTDPLTLPVEVRCTGQQMELTSRLPLPGELVLACRSRVLCMAVTAVIEQTGRKLSYWALAHGGAEADFHRRKDFTLQMEYGFDI